VAAVCSASFAATELDNAADASEPCASTAAAMAALCASSFAFTAAWIRTRSPFCGKYSSVVPSRWPRVSLRMDSSSFASQICNSTLSVAPSIGTCLGDEPPGERIVCAWIMVQAWCQLSAQPRYLLLLLFEQIGYRIEWYISR
jgi:hypothetical protein